MWRGLARGDLALPSGASVVSLPRPHPRRSGSGSPLRGFGFALGPSALASRVFAGRFEVACCLCGGVLLEGTWRSLLGRASFLSLAPILVALAPAHRFAASGSLWGLRPLALLGDLRWLAAFVAGSCSRGTWRSLLGRASFLSLAPILVALAPAHRFAASGSLWGLRPLALLGDLRWLAAFVAGSCSRGLGAPFWGERRFSPSPPSSSPLAPAHRFAASGSLWGLWPLALLGVSSWLVAFAGLSARRCRGFGGGGAAFVRLGSALNLGGGDCRLAKLAVGCWLEAR